MIDLERQYKQPVEQLLRKLYIDEELTLAEIALRLEIPLPTVGRWMSRLGIQARSRGRRPAVELSA